MIEMKAKNSERNKETEPKDHPWILRGQSESLDSSTLRFKRHTARRQPQLYSRIKPEQDERNGLPDSER